MEGLIQAPGVGPDLLPKRTLAFEPLSPRLLAIGLDETEQIATREARIEGREEQAPQILDQPSFRHAVPNLDAMQVNEHEVQRIAGLPLVPIAIANEKVAQVIVPMIQTGGVHAASDVSDFAQQNPF